MQYLLFPVVTKTDNTPPNLRPQTSRCGCAAVGSQRGLGGFRLDETSEINAAVSAQTRPTGGAWGVRNYFMGLNMFSHWLSLAEHTG